MAQLQRDSFEKVERVFVTGLRARDTPTRHKFFALYNSAIECTLFARMRYIIVEQDWEQLAAFFWLKQALVSKFSPFAFRMDITLWRSSAWALTQALTLRHVHDHAGSSQSGADAASRNIEAAQ